MASPRQKEWAKTLTTALKERLKKEGIQARVKGDMGDYTALNIVSPTYETPFNEAQKQTILRIAKAAGFTGVRASVLDPTGTANGNQITLYYNSKPVDPKVILTASVTLEARARRRKKKKGGPVIAVETGIVPDIVAAQVADETLKNNASLLPKAKSLIATLSAKAEAIYRTDAGFKKSLSDSDTGRTALRDQMRVWAAAYVKDNTKTTESTAMSSISTLIASGSTKILPALKPPAPKQDAIASLITAKAPAKKAPAASKSHGGLKTKLAVLAKKYPGVKFEVQKLKTKQNQIKVSGLGKLTQKELHELFRQIPNTSPIPNKMAPGVAYFTLFGKKEITATAPLEAGDKPRRGFATEAEAVKAGKKYFEKTNGDKGVHNVDFHTRQNEEGGWHFEPGKKKVTTAASAKKPRPYYVLLEGLKVGGNGWTIQFGDYDKKVVEDELQDTKEHNRNNGEKKLQYKIIKVADAKQKTINEAVKALTASTEAPGKSLGAVASLLSAAPANLTAIADDKFAKLKKDDVVYIRSLNKPTHRVEPIAWNSKNGHVIKASFMGHDNNGNLRLFCDTGLGTAEGQGPVSVPKEWASLEYNVTASILLNPNVGDTGVVYRDPTSTDSEFAASDHEGQGAMFVAKVKEVKGQRIRIDAAAPDRSASYKDAWIFATHLYKNPKTDTRGTLSAQLDADMIDGYVMQHIATTLRSTRTSELDSDNVRSAIKNVDPKDVDTALARLNASGVITMTDKKIYPSGELMEVFASTLAQRTAIETAKKAMLDAQTAHKKNPNPMNRKRLDTAKRVYAKHLRDKKASGALVEKGPPKPKRTAAGVQVAA